MNTNINEMNNKIFGYKELKQVFINELYDGTLLNYKHLLIYLKIYKKFQLKM